MTNPFIERAKAKKTPIERTFVNVYDKPKTKGALKRIVEIFTDQKEAVKAMDDAPRDYTHRIGVVLYTKEELEQWIKKGG